MRKSEAVDLYIGAVYVLALLLSVFIGLTGGQSGRYGGLGIFSMLIPAIGVLVMQYGFREPVESVNWGVFPVKWLPIALFMMPAAIHVIVLPLSAYLHNASIPWQSWLKPDGDGLYHSPPDRNWGVLSSGNLAGRILINALTGVVVVSILAFFEEIGWRAWLLPRLINLYGFKTGIFAGAVIWAIWHIPFIAGRIHVVEGVPIGIVLFAYPLGVLGAGLVISWVWVRTRSIWLICLAHGSLNNWGQYAFKYIDAPTGEHYLFIAVNGVLLIIGLIILISMKSDRGFGKVA